MVRWIRGGRIRDIELDGIKRERYRPLSSLFPLRFVLICLADEKKNTAGGGGGKDTRIYSARLADRFLPVSPPFRVTGLSSVS